MSGAKKQQTMAKRARERAVKEKRELKLEKKRERRLAAAGGEEVADTAEPQEALPAGDPETSPEAHAADA